MYFIQIVKSCIKKNPTRRNGEQFTIVILNPQAVMVSALITNSNLITKRYSSTGETLEFLPLFRLRVLPVYAGVSGKTSFRIEHGRNLGISPLVSPTSFACLRWSVRQNINTKL
ncbi:hypothetical protein FUT79_11945 [Treponema phagedenis]|nr:hypothetical protein FUT79_11945 [Treponema phagedenis]